METQRLLFAIVLLTTAFLVLLPVVLLISYSFVESLPGQPLNLGFDAWRHAVESPLIMGSLVNSVLLLLSTHSISLPVAVVIAWVLARTDLPFRNGFEFMFWISFFMPTLSILMGWILCLDPEYGLLNKLFELLPFVDKGPFNIFSFWGIVWGHLATHAITIKVMLLTPIFRNIDSSFEEASAICGANRVTTLIRVMVPAVTPAILAITLIAMIRAMQSFEIEMVLGSPIRLYVYSTLVYSLIEQEPPDFGAASALATIGLGCLLPLIFAQRWVGLRRQYVSVSGRMKSASVRLGPWRTPVFLAICTVVLILTVIPIVFLGLTSTMKLFGFFNIPEPWTWGHWATVFADESFRQSVINTLQMSAGAALVAIVLLSLIAYFSVRSSFKGRSLLDFVSWLPAAVPGVLFSLGLLYAFLEIPLFRPLYGSMALMIIAAVMGSMTLGTQIFKSAMLQLSRDIEEASAVSGATWLRTFRSVVLPIVVPTVLLVGITIFITAAREIASVSLVATGGTKTLSLLQLDYMVQGRYGPAAVISFIVILMSTGLALAARALGLRIGLKN
ncbi:MAG TPA: iron ABC transporter permease [Alphaproteobacteria bacterium]|jgi:iron(III) transport system permease protein